MRLLILNCSSRKRGPTEPIPALERYDGPLWQVLRAFLREHDAERAKLRTENLLSIDPETFGSPSAIRGTLDVYGLSAEYGLIPATQLIPHYERLMDDERADQLRVAVLNTLQILFNRRAYSQLCLGVSQRYMPALRGWEAFVPPETVVTLTDGTAAIKLGQLRAWLRGEDWQGIGKRPLHMQADVNPRGTVRIGGVTLSMSRDEALARARVALAENARQAKVYRYWYAVVDGQPVGAKWLASILSGLPTTAFQAAQARQALLALGIDIESSEQ